MASRYFFCERWQIMMAEDVCINRYKKGVKKCEGCKEGARRVATLLETRIPSATSKSSKEREIEETEDT